MSFESISSQPETKNSLQLKEIERKFSVKYLPYYLRLNEAPRQEIIQGYISNGAGRNTVRIRKKGERYEWTVKQKYGSNPMERIELECEITKEQFDTMWPATEGRRLVKTRYYIPYAKNVIELDIFRGELEGNVLAEVEFTSVKDAESFNPPDWFGPDVTMDSNYRNSSIAKNGFPGSSVSNGLSYD